MSGLIGLILCASLPRRALLGPIVAASDGSFDSALSTAALEHLAELRAVLAGSLRILKPAALQSLRNRFSGIHSPNLRINSGFPNTA